MQKKKLSSQYCYLGFTLWKKFILCYSPQNQYGKTSRGFFIYMGRSSMIDHFSYEAADHKN